MVEPEDATALLEAVIRSGNRLCMEGDDQKHASKAGQILRRMQAMAA